MQMAVSSTYSTFAILTGYFKKDVGSCYFAVKYTLKLVGGRKLVGNEKKRWFYVKNESK